MQVYTERRLRNTKLSNGDDRLVCLVCPPSKNGCSFRTQVNWTISFYFLADSGLFMSRGIVLCTTYSTVEPWCILTSGDPEIFPQLAVLTSKADDILS